MSYSNSPYSSSTPDAAMLRLGTTQRSSTSSFARSRTVFNIGWGILLALDRYSDVTRNIGSSPPYFYSVFLWFAKCGQFAHMQRTSVVWNSLLNPNSYGFIMVLVACAILLCDRSNEYEMIIKISLQQLDVCLWFWTVNGNLITLFFSHNEIFLTIIPLLKIKFRISPK